MRDWQLRAALRRARHFLLSSPSVDSVESLACCALRPSTRKDYASSLSILEKHIRDSPPSPRCQSPRSASARLDAAASELLVQKARQCLSHSSLQGTISALRWAGNNLGLPFLHKNPLHDTLVRAVPQSDSQLRWIHPSTLQSICDMPNATCHDNVFVCLAALSFWHAMRVSETCRVRATDFDWSAVPPTVTIHPSKGRAGPRRPEPVCTPLQPAAVPYARAFCQLQRNPGPQPTAASLNAWLRERVRRTRDAGATWHSFRRGCATFMQHCGASIDEICVRGRWADRATARLYIYPWHD